MNGKLSKCSSEVAKNGACEDATLRTNLAGPRSYNASFGAGATYAEARSQRFYLRRSR
jgi:hypothetical protein